MKIKFALNLKNLRIEANMSQLELANKLQTTQRKISYWELGKTEPDLKSLMDIATLFNVSIDFLVGKTEI